MSLLGFVASKISLIRLVKPSVTVKTLRYCYQSNRENHRKTIFKPQPQKIRFFLARQFLDKFRGFDKVLEKRFPAAIKVYRVFVVGCGEFIRESKEYFRIVMWLNKPQNKMSHLTRKQIEIYHQVPKDMMKVAPVLFIFALPGGYIILPIAYAFPRHLLTQSFWTIEQRSAFKQLEMRDRLVHNRPVFRHLQSQLNFLKPHSLYRPWKRVLGMLGSGTQPCVKEIVACKDLFRSEPYHLMYLSSNHVKHLMRIHEMGSGFFRRGRLAEKAYLLMLMDKAIIREGGVRSLPFETLKNCCCIRGLNPLNLSNEEMIMWLTSWIQFSSQIDRDCYSLLLHGPVLLAYNEPSNWKLLYEKT